jgi:hypothetical protein
MDREEERSQAVRKSYLGQVMLLVLIATVLVFIVWLAQSAVEEGRNYGLEEFNVGLLVVMLVLIVSALFFMTLPVAMVAFYHSSRTDLIVRRIKTDLKLCGYEDADVEKREEEFRERNGMLSFVWPMVGHLAFLFSFWGLFFAPNGLGGMWYSLYEEGNEFETVFGKLTDIDGIAFFTYLVENAPLVTWTFLGAYFYITTVIVRRWAQEDLTSSVLWRNNTRLAIAFVVGILLMAVAPDTSPVIAFLAGIVPEMGIRFASNTVKLNRATLGAPDLASASRLQCIGGLDFWHAARLADEGIDNMQNLATEEIAGLLIRTRIDTQRLLCWMDQAILLYHLQQTGIKGLDEIFHQACIGRATVLLDLVGVKGDGPLHDECVRAVYHSLQPGLAAMEPTLFTEDTLRNLVSSIRTYADVGFIREYWHNTRTPETRNAKLSATHGIRGG